MKGLLAAVLGGVSKGAGQVAAGQIEVNARQALMEAEEEMRARLAEAAEGRAEKRDIAAEERRLANIPREAGATAEAQEGLLRRRFAEGSDYPELRQRQLDADTTPGQRLEQERSQGQLDDEQQIRDLRQTIATMPESDPALPGLKRQLEALSGSTSRLDPLVAAEIGDLQYQTRQATADYERAVSDYDDAAIAVAREKLDRLQAQKDRLFGRSLGDADPLGLL